MNNFIDLAINVMPNLLAFLGGIWIFTSFLMVMGSFREFDTELIKEGTIVMVIGFSLIISAVVFQGKLEVKNIQATVEEIKEVQSLEVGDKVDSNLSLHLRNYFEVSKDEEFVIDVNNEEEVSNVIKDFKDNSRR